MTICFKLTWVKMVETRGPTAAISLGFCIQESLGLPWAFGGPTDRVGDSFNFFLRPLSKHLHIREKHATDHILL